jgi:hypothetical protein
MSMGRLLFSDVVVERGVLPEEEAEDKPPGCG